MALDVGADGIELDVTLSADEVPVIIHDDTLERTTNGYGRVMESTLAELQALDAGTWFEDRFSSETIPTLAQVLELGRDRFSLINVELKGGWGTPPSLVEEVLGVLEQMVEPEQIILSSFDPGLLRQVRKQDPERRWRCGLLFAQKGWVSRAWPLWNRILDADFLHPTHELARLVAESTGRADQMNVWTVNDPGAILELQALGMHGVITDRPDLAKDILQEHGTDH